MNSIQWAIEMYQNDPHQEYERYSTPELIRKTNLVDDTIMVCELCGRTYEYIRRAYRIDGSCVIGIYYHNQKRGKFIIPTLGKAKVACPNCLHGANTVPEVDHNSHILLRLYRDRSYARHD